MSPFQSQTLPYFRIYLIAIMTLVISFQTFATSLDMQFSMILFSMFQIYITCFWHTALCTLLFSFNTFSNISQC